jgi:hypothetical protein
MPFLGDGDEGTKMSKLDAQRSDDNAGGPPNEKSPPVRSHRQLIP